MARKKNYKSKNNRGLVIYWVIVLLVIVGILQGKSNAFPLVLIPVFILIIKWLIKWLKNYARKQKYKRSSLAEIDKMTGTEFEEFLLVHFEKNGYKVKHVGKTGDFGVDILLTSKQGEKIAVQAKRYNSSVGVKSVQEAVSGREYYKCDKAFVVTNSIFTKAAIELANKCGVELWNRDVCRKVFSLAETRQYTSKKG